MRVRDADPVHVGVDAAVARVAARQHGVFAREQVTPLGATRGIFEHRLRTGRWELLAPRVFRVAGAPPSWHQALMVACLAWGRGATISHRAGAPLWSVVGFDPGPVELTVPLRRRRRGPGIVHRNLLRPAEVTTVEGIPVTTPVRTLLDIASVMPIETVEEALDDMLRRRLVSLPRLRRYLRAAGRRGRPGVTAMRAVLDARDPSASVPDSVFETRLLRVLKRARLPEPVLQHRISVSGRTVAVVDFAYPDARVAFEADGYRWHSGRVRWERDLARRNELTLLGWRVVHVTWADVTRRPHDVVASVRTALRVQS